MFLKRFAVATVVLLAANVVMAQAQAPQVQQPAAEGMAACRADMQTLCGGVAGGRQGRMQCLIQNRDKASPECAAMLTAIAEKGPRAGRADKDARPGQACRADVQALCGTVERGAARQQCLRQNEAKLSPACKEAITRAADRRQDMQAACRTDRQTLCQGANRGPGENAKEGTPGGMLRCLRENEAKLSAECRAAIGQMSAPKARGSAATAPAAGPSSK